MADYPTDDELPDEPPDTEEISLWNEDPSDYDDINEFVRAEHEATMTDDIPYPDAPTPEELEAQEPESFADAVDDGPSQMADPDSWYNTAPKVAANLIVRVANEHDEFRQHMLDADRGGAAHAMKKFDADAHETLNTMGLSMLQGGQAESMAQAHLKDDD